MSGSTTKSDIIGVILAGGQSRRMGGQDKGLLQVAGQPLIHHVVQSLAPQVKELWISANRHVAQYQRLGYRVIPDRHADYPGPLAGMYSALCQLADGWILTAPCDAPALSADFAPRMWQCAQTSPQHPCVAFDGRRLQPVFALIPKALQTEMGSALQRGELGVGKWFTAQHATECDFSDHPDMFTNLNTPDDLQQWQANHLS